MYLCIDLSIIELFYFFIYVCNYLLIFCSFILYFMYLFYLVIIIIIVINMNRLYLFIACCILYNLHNVYIYIHIIGKPWGFNLYHGVQTNHVVGSTSDVKNSLFI